MSDIERVRAALAEGFCPAGHPLSHGGGKWGSCDTCATIWTVTVPGFDYRPYGPPGAYVSVSEHGSSVMHEMSAGFSDKR